jgi:transposase
MRKRRKGGDCRGEPGAGREDDEIALRHGLHRNQLYEWRRQFRSVAGADAGLVASGFVPVVAENQDGSGATAIEIEIGDATLRVGRGLSLAFWARWYAC